MDLHKKIGYCRGRLAGAGLGWIRLGGLGWLGWAGLGLAENRNKQANTNTRIDDSSKANKPEQRYEIAFSDPG